ncbi:MAG TPA: YbaK/EbsC family protein [Methylomirabilota bacterium]|jgi:Ala-tRNA(Pro) deacylase|nr:YbaK/EbsC family protein [Methylomirabilota bacterium]
MISKNLEKLLKTNKLKYEVVEHRKVYTAFDSAETQDIKLTEVAKAVLLKGKKSLYLAVLPAGNNCDFKSVSKLADDKLSMAKEKDINEKLKSKIGLIPPFGSLFKLPVFIDKKLLKNKKINLPAGSYTESVIMNVKDYIKLENPVPGNFAIKK